jgi:hypothetical protein
MDASAAILSTVRCVRGLHFIMLIRRYYIDDVTLIQGTVTACAKKCTLTPGCLAFDACAKAGPCGCYIFVGQLVQPFTANAGSLTCVKTGQLETPSGIRQ